MTLVERLTRKHRVQPPFGGGSLTHDGKATGYITDDGMRLVNPDGPEAADEIERLRAQVDTMEDVLREARLQLEYIDERFPTGTTPAMIAKIDAALASMEQQPPAILAALRAGSSSS